MSSLPMSWQPHSNSPARPFRNLDRRGLGKLGIGKKRPCPRRGQRVLSWRAASRPAKPLRLLVDTKVAHGIASHSSLRFVGRRLPPWSRPGASRTAEHAGGLCRRGFSGQFWNTTHSAVWRYPACAKFTNGAEALPPTVDRSSSMSWHQFDVRVQTLGVPGDRWGVRCDRFMHLL